MNVSWRRLPPVAGPIALPALLQALTASLTEDADVLLDRVHLALNSHYHSRSVRLTQSGTHALEIALRLHQATAKVADLRKRVALPAWCCPDIATATIAAGSNIVLYDLDPHSLAPNMDSLQSALDEGVDSVVLVQYFGRIVDPTPICELANLYNASVIEDAAQGAGASLRGMRAGALADIGIISFGRGKGRNAGGGGAVISAQPLSNHAPGFIDSFAELRLWGTAAAVALLGSPLPFSVVSRLAGGIGQTRFVPPSADDRLSRVVAALVCHALGREDGDAARRRVCAQRWREILDGGVELLSDSTDRSVTEGALRFPLLIDPDTGTEAIQFGLVRSYPRTLNEYPEILRYMTKTARKLPGAQYLARRLHTLPTHKFVSESDMRAVASRVIRKTAL